MCLDRITFVFLLLGKGADKQSSLSLPLSLSAVVYHLTIIPSLSLSFTDSMYRPH